MAKVYTEPKYAKWIERRSTTKGIYMSIIVMKNTKLRKRSRDHKYIQPSMACLRTALWAAMAAAWAAAFLSMAALDASKDAA